LIRFSRPCAQHGAFPGYVPRIDSRSERLWRTIEFFISARATRFPCPIYPNHSIHTSFERPRRFQLSQPIEMCLRSQLSSAKKVEMDLGCHPRRQAAGDLPPRLPAGLNFRISWTRMDVCGIYTLNGAIIRHFGPRCSLFPQSLFQNRW